MKEISGFIDSLFRSRVKNRFFGAFVFSWIVYNWKTLLVLFFADEPMQSKVEQASTQLGAWDTVVPVILAVAYLYGTHWVSYLVDIFQDAPIQKRKTRKHDDRMNSLRREMEYENERLKFEQLKLERFSKQELGESIRAEFTKRITECKEDLSKRQAEMAELEKTLRSIRDSLQQKNHDLRLVKESVQKNERD